MPDERGKLAFQFGGWVWHLHSHFMKIQLSRWEGLGQPKGRSVVVVVVAVVEEEEDEEEAKDS